jgi:hypothetical protein
VSTCPPRPRRNVYRRTAGGGSVVREPDACIEPCESDPTCDFPTPIKIPRDQLCFGPQSPIAARELVSTISG